MTLQMPMPCEAPATGPAAELADKVQALLPVIETGRLRLRAPRVTDFAAYAEILTSPRGAYISEDRSREGAWLDFTQMVATWMLRGHGVWAVETRVDNTVLGFVLLGFEPGDHEPELGFIFRDIAEGKGYAHEAAEAVRRYGFDTLEMSALVSTIDPGNARSRALAERLGGTRDARAEAAHGGTVLVYRYQKPEAR